MRELEKVYIIYKNSFDDKPYMCFAREADAHAVCNAINAHENGTSELWLAHVEEYPMIGGDYEY